MNPPPPVSSISIPSPGQLRRKAVGRNGGKPSTEPSARHHSCGTVRPQRQRQDERVPTRHHSCGASRPQHRQRQDQNERVPLSRKSSVNSPKKINSSSNNKVNTFSKASSIQTNDRPSIKAQRKNGLFEHRKGPISEPSTAPSVESPPPSPPNNTTPVQSPPRRTKSMTPPSRHNNIQSLPPPKSPFRITLRRRASKGPYEKKKSRSFRGKRDDASEQRQGPLHQFMRRQQTVNEG